MSREHVHRGSLTSSLKRSSLVKNSVFESATSKIFPIEPDIDFDSPPRRSPERTKLIGGGGSSVEEPLMGRIGPNSRNLEGNKNRTLQQKRQQPRKSKSPHLPDSRPPPTYYRRGSQGGLNRAPVNSPPNMEFLRGIYAFMQVSRSSVNHVKIDSAVFRLHTNATVVLLVTFSIAVTTRQYVGNPIDCVHTRDIPEDVLNTYCWIHSTYTVVDAFAKKQGAEVPFPGIDNSLGHRGAPLTIRHTKYYQWVAFTLFFQGEKMLDIFRGLKNLVKVSHVHIDSPVFRLHYSITVMMLMSFSLIVTTRQYVGNPIDCVHTKDIPEDVLNTYCWIHSTYALKSLFNKTVGSKVPYPGIGNSEGKLADRKVYKYYQWVCFCLFFQAILFYTPRWLWKSWEGGKIHALMMDLDIGICSEMEKKQKKNLLLDYLWENLRYHNWWAYRYYVCEFLSLVNVIGQMFLMNKFFDGEFMEFGIKVIKYMDADQEDRLDPMIYVFPRMTKCTFYKYGVSGEVERHDAICILPLNVVNEKIYIFLWFWFILLFFLTTLTLIYRVVIIFSPRMRVYLLRLRFRLVKRDAIEVIVRRSKMGDWFLLYMLGENIDTVIFRDIMQELSNKLNTNQHHHVPGMKGQIQDA